MHIVIVGAGINGLVAANYLLRSGCRVTMLERAHRVGGACVSATAVFEGMRHDYAHGASVLGLMQDFVWEETGLAARLRSFAPTHPKLVHFPGHDAPVWIWREPERLDREFEDRFGERGDAVAFRTDEARVVEFLRQGYRDAHPPTLADAEATLGAELTRRWITGSARALLEHYFTSEGARVYMAMTVTESGPVSLSEPYSAFIIPMMDSGSVFGSYYGFVRGGIWQIPIELDRINRELGADVRLGCAVKEIDTRLRQVAFEENGERRRVGYDHLLMATDTVTAARLAGTPELARRTGEQRLLGSAGKVTLLFRKPVRWKHGSAESDSETAFRFVFSESTLSGFEAAAGAVTRGTAYSPGYTQIYCEGAAMRQMGLHEPFDRLAVFFNFLALDRPGAEWPQVEEQVRDAVLNLISNPEDWVWSRLLSPRDLQETFLFPGGNLDHTMLVAGQTYFDRGYSSDPETQFYRLGGDHHVHVCGAGTYPCGSVAGTPGYMCAKQLLRTR
ncbi:MAG: NAD(P)/FAD-dependent oxidoreductase [Gammaproteobacteria bacterium]|nr:NAD(P)/FAD-dependent oxidoreductase [Gammaproteobacteria bacterium]